MNTVEIINRIEALIDKNKNDASSDSKEKKNKKKKKEINPIVELSLLILSFILDILKSPFKLIAKYVKNELFEAVKKDLLLYMILGFLMGVLFIFFSVLWLSLSVAVGVYYFEQGKTIFSSVLYSLAFQGIFFTFISLIAFISMSQLNSLKILRKTLKLK